MDIKTAIKHFGSQSALAQALGLDRQVVWNWKERGQIPIGRQYQIQVITKNKVKV